MNNNLIVLFATLFFLGCGSSSTDNSNQQADTSITADTSTSDTSTSDTAQEDTTTSTAPKKIQFIAIGDFGTGKQGQFDVAAGIKTFCATNQCDFVMGLGDAIYEYGISKKDGVADKQFQDAFETPYKDIDLKFYQTIGNHDTGFLKADEFGNWAAMVLYTSDTTYNKTAKWQLTGTEYPGVQTLKDSNFREPWYSFERENALFIAIDSERVSDSAVYERQLKWIGDTLKKNTKHWRIAFGHYPIKSNGTHGDTGKEGENVLLGNTVPRGKFLRESLCTNVDIYISAHDHNFEYLQDHCGVILVISGVGAKQRTFTKGGNTIFGLGETLGFAVVTIDGENFSFRFLDENAKELYKSPVLKKRQYKCDADDVCEGRCANDPDCRGQDCSKNGTCNPACSQDPDCYIQCADPNDPCFLNACPCDKKFGVCEPSAPNGSQKCGCDQDCWNGSL